MNKKISIVELLIFVVCSVETSLCSAAIVNYYHHGGDGRGFYAYGTETDTSTFRTPVTGTQRALSFAVRPSDGAVFAADHQDSKSKGFFQVDPYTGDFSLIANTPSPYLYRSISFHPNMGDLFAVAWDGNYWLAKVDPSTAQPTILGETRFGLTIAFSPTGQLYGIPGHSRAPDKGELYLIDKDTGGTTLVGGQTPVENVLTQFVITQTNEAYGLDHDGIFYATDLATGVGQRIGTTGLGQGAFGVFVLEPEKIEVALDIKPGSCPNPLNVKSKGVLPVAILGSADFDVNTIDVASIRLAGVAPTRSSCEDVATPVPDANECECSTAGPDGYTDLTLKFETQEIVNTLGDVNDGDVLLLTLTGVLLDEIPIEGGDCIVVRGKFKPLNRADINKDGVVDHRDFAIFAGNWLQSSIVED